MSNADAIREGIDAFNRRDFDAALALIRDDVTWERFLSATEADDPVVRGRDELLAIWKSQVEAVDLRVEPLEFTEHGNQVVVPTEMVAQGAGSEIKLTAKVTWLWTLDSEGLVARVEVFERPDEALAALDTAA